MVSNAFARYLEPLLFPVKLYELAHSNEVKSIYWSPDGAAVKLDTEKLGKECFRPEIFNVADHKHVFRQLSYYGFCRVERLANVWEFYHPSFKADDFDLVQKIKRKGKKNKNAITASDVKSYLPSILAKRSLRYKNKTKDEDIPFSFEAPKWKEPPYSESLIKTESPENARESLENVRETPENARALRSRRKRDYTSFFEEPVVNDETFLDYLNISERNEKPQTSKGRRERVRHSCPEYILKQEPISVSSTATQATARRGRRKGRSTGSGRKKSARKSNRTSQCGCSPENDKLHSSTGKDFNLMKMTVMQPAPAIKGRKRSAVTKTINVQNLEKKKKPKRRYVRKKRGGGRKKRGPSYHATLKSDSCNFSNIYCIHTDFKCPQNKSCNLIDMQNDITNYQRDSVFLTSHSNTDFRPFMSEALADKSTYLADVYNTELCVASYFQPNSESHILPVQLIKKEASVLQKNTCAKNLCDIADDENITEMFICPEISETHKISLKSSKENCNRSLYEKNAFELQCAVIKDEVPICKTISDSVIEKNYSTNNNLFSSGTPSDFDEVRILWEKPETQKGANYSLIESIRNEHNYHCPVENTASSNSWSSHDSSNQLDDLLGNKIKKENSNVFSCSTNGLKKFVLGKGYNWKPLIGNSMPESYGTNKTQNERNFPRSYGNVDNNKCLVSSGIDDKLKNSCNSITYPNGALLPNEQNERCLKNNSNVMIYQKGTLSDGMSSFNETNGDCSIINSNSIEGTFQTMLPFNQTNSFQGSITNQPASNKPVNKTKKSTNKKTYTVENSVINNPVYLCSNPVSSRPSEAFSNNYSGNQNVGLIQNYPAAHCLNLCNGHVDVHFSKYPVLNQTVSHCNQLEVSADVDFDSLQLCNCKNDAHSVRQLFSDQAVSTSMQSEMANIAALPARRRNISKYSAFSKQSVKKKKKNPRKKKSTQYKMRDGNCLKKKQNNCGTYLEGNRDIYFPADQDICGSSSNLLHSRDAYNENDFPSLKILDIDNELPELNDSDIDILDLTDDLDLTDAFDRKNDHSKIYVKPEIQEDDYGLPCSLKKELIEYLHSQYMSDKMTSDDILCSENPFIREYGFDAITLGISPFDKM